MTNINNKIPEWTADALGKMHLNRISITQLAEHMSCRREYISRIFNGSQTLSEKKKVEIESAINEIIENQ